MLKNIPSHLPVDLHLLRALLAAIKTYPKPQLLSVQEQQKVQRALDGLLTAIYEDSESFKQVTLDVMEHTQYIHSYSECLVGAVLLAGRIKYTDFELESSQSAQKKPYKPYKPACDSLKTQCTAIQQHLVSFRPALYSMRYLVLQNNVDFDVFSYHFQRYRAAVQTAIDAQVKKLKTLKKKDVDSSQMESYLAELRKSHTEMSAVTVEKAHEIERLVATNQLLTYQVAELQGRLKMHEQQQSSYIYNNSDTMHYFKELQRYLFEAQAQIVSVRGEKERLQAELLVSYHKMTSIEQSHTQMKNHADEREMQAKYAATETRLLKEYNDKLKELVEYYQNKEKLLKMDSAYYEKTQVLNSFSKFSRSGSETEDDSMGDSMTQVRQKYSIDEIILRKIDSLGHEKQYLEKCQVKVHVLQAELIYLYEQNSVLQAKLYRSQTSENLLIYQNERIVVLELENKDLKQVNYDLETRCKVQENRISKMQAELDVLRRFVK